MRKDFTVFSTNQLNKYNHILPFRTLESGIWKTATIGLPTHLSHDMHRLIGWCMPFAIYIEPKIAYTVGHTYRPENAEDSEKIVNARNSQFRKSHLESINKYKNEFIAEFNKGYDENKGVFHYPSAFPILKPMCFLKRIQKSYF